MFFVQAWCSSGKFFVRSGYNSRTSSSFLGNFKKKLLSSVNYVTFVALVFLSYISFHGASLGFLYLRKTLPVGGVYFGTSVYSLENFKEIA